MKTDRKWTKLYNQWKLNRSCNCFRCRHEAKKIASQLKQLNCHFDEFTLMKGS